MAATRRFGKIRLLPSGRFQASFMGPDGRRQKAPDTFRMRQDAQRWLNRVEDDLRRGRWVNDQLGQRTFRQCAGAYLEENPRIGRRWAETCRRNMRLHMVSLLDMPIASISPPVVRAWHAKALRGNGGRTSIAQSYRFLRSVMSVAVQDEAIPRNPCQIPSAGGRNAPERSIATSAQVQTLIDRITPRYRAPVVLAAWCGLRRGEVCGLRTADVNLAAGTVRVRKTWVELLESPDKYEKDPKSEAGKRTVTVPPHVLHILATHAAEWAGPEFFCVGRDGKRMSGNALYQAFVRARNLVGLSIAFHDLRHTGQSLAAAAGASVADLKKRLGHSSSVAALCYMHAIEGRDAEVAQFAMDLQSQGCEPVTRGIA
jgi:integrase